jgi:SUKH-4 immunity protein
VRVTGADRDRSPRFELADLTGLDTVPDWLRDGLAGVPRGSIDGHYRATSEATFVDVPGRGPLIRFGTTGVFGPIYVDPSSGAVVAGDDVGEELCFANSSLEQFTRTVRGLIDLFPYYEESGDYEEAEAAAARASELIAGIDPPAAEPDTVWGTFIDDVANGDFATRDILQWDGAVGPGSPR